MLLVEATDRFGGTTAYSAGGGMWFPANPVLTRAGTDDTVEDALEYYRAVVGDRTPAPLQEAFVRGGAPLIEYLERDEGLRFRPLPWPDYFGTAPKARADGMRHICAKPLRVSAAPELRELVRGPLDVDRRGAAVPEDYFVGGRALIARLLAATRSARAPSGASAPRWSSWCWRAAGCAARCWSATASGPGSGPGAGAAIAGGFEHNDELRARYRVPGSSRDTMGPSGNRGLAHLAGIAAGADTDLMDQAWWSPGLTHPDGRSAFALWFTGGIFVDADGRRFVNESAAYDRLGREILISRPPAGSASGTG